MKRLPPNLAPPNPLRVATAGGHGVRSCPVPSRSLGRDRIMNEMVGFLDLVKIIGYFSIVLTKLSYFDAGNPSC